MLQKFFNISMYMFSIMLGIVMICIGIMYIMWENDEVLAEITDADAANIDFSHKEQLTDVEELALQLASKPCIKKYLEGSNGKKYKENELFAQIVSGGIFKSYSEQLADQNNQRSVPDIVYLSINTETEPLHYYCYLNLEDMKVYNINDPMMNIAFWMERL